MNSHGTSIRLYERPDKHTRPRDYAKRMDHRTTRGQKIAGGAFNLFLGTCAVAFVFCAIEVTYSISRTADAEAREEFKARQMNAAAQQMAADYPALRAKVADLESWDCAQVRPQYRQTTREYQWCQRQRNER